MFLDTPTSLSPTCHLHTSFTFLNRQFLSMATRPRAGTCLVSFFAGVKEGCSNHMKIHNGAFRVRSFRPWYAVGVVPCEITTSRAHGLSFRPAQHGLGSTQTTHPVSSLVSLTAQALGAHALETAVCGAFVALDLAILLRPATRAGPALRRGFAHAVLVLALRTSRSSQELSGVGRHSLSVGDGWLRNPQISAYE